MQKHTEEQNKERCGSPAGCLGNIWKIRVFTETRKIQVSELEGGGCGGWGTVKLTPGQVYFYNTP